jgi:hypothetical protein
MTLTVPVPARGLTLHDSGGLWAPVERLGRVPATGFARRSIGGHRVASRFSASAFPRCHRVRWPAALF